MSAKTEYTDPASYPDLTDLFVQIALRFASKSQVDETLFLGLRVLYQELASIHEEPDPNKLITKMGLALALGPGDDLDIRGFEEAK